MYTNQSFYQLEKISPSINYELPLGAVSMMFAKTKIGAISIALNSKWSLHKSDTEGLCNPDPHEGWEVVKVLSDFDPRETKEPMSRYYRQLWNRVRELQGKEIAKMRGLTPQSKPDRAVTLK